MQAAEIDSSGVKMMIDKSVTERHSLTELGISYLLCIFHMLQEIERFLKSGDSGVHGRGRKDERLEILHRVRKLQRLTDKAAFENEWNAYKQELRSKDLDLVADYLTSHWEHDAPYWAAWGRSDVADLACDTNNLIERFGGLLKYPCACTLA